jgi:hypothetical protein
MVKTYIDSDPVPSTDELLLAHLKQHGYEKRHGPVADIEPADNLLKQDIFRIVYFADGSWMTFCQGYGPFVWRHRGGGRYGPRSQYEHIVKPGEVEKAKAKEDSTK